MLKSQMWPNSYIYICYLFRFDVSPKKLFVSCNYHVLFLCQIPMVFKVNDANIQYIWILLDIQIVQDSLCTAVLTIIFFYDYSYHKYGLFFSLVGLILWLKVYITFNNLCNLKVMLCECKLRFKIGSLKYSAWGNFIHGSSFHRYLPGSFMCFFSKKPVK